MIRRLATAAGMIAALAVPVHAQTRVGLSAVAGGYLPAADLFDSLRPGGGDNPIVLNLGHRPGPLIGGRLTLRLSRIAVEAEVAYAFADLDVPSILVDAGLSADASLFLGSLNVLYDLFRAPFSPLSLYASAGVGFVARRGDLLDAFEGATDPAGAIGLGVRFGLGPAIYLRFDLRDYISSFSATTRSGFTFDSKIQNDLLATLALEFVFAPAR